MKLAEITTPKAGEENKVLILFKKGAVIVSDPEIGPDDVIFMTCADPNPFHPVNDKDFQAAQRAAIKKLKATATADGIELKTAAEAKAVVENFLEALGYEAEVTFEDKELNLALPH